MCSYIALLHFTRPVLRSNWRTGTLWREQFFTIVFVQVFTKLVKFLLEVACQPSYMNGFELKESSQITKFDGITKPFATNKKKLHVSISVGGCAIFQNSHWFQEMRNQMWFIFLSSNQNLGLKHITNHWVMDGEWNLVICGFNSFSGL